MSDDIEKQDDVLAGWIEEFEAERAELATKDDDHFCNWYLRHVNQADADEVKVKEMSATMLREIANRRKALQYVHGQQFRNRVGAAIDAQPGKKKSVNFLMGKAGFRSAPEHIEIKDMEKLADWLREPEQIKMVTETVNGLNITTGVIAVLWETLSRAAWVSIVSSVRKTPIMEYIKNNVDKETGEAKVPPGVELIGKFDKFTINGKAVDDTPLLEESKDE